ncbi:MAG TPA: hypothetical protein PLU30_07345 [Verrucomicrobiae bacterium]|nr:hypothetical protein [Verrucomicrobiae bacterium]
MGFGMLDCPGRWPLFVAGALGMATAAGCGFARAEQSVVTIEATQPIAEEYQLKQAGFIFHRTGDTARDLFVIIELPGSGDPPEPGIASPGVDYMAGGVIVDHEEAIPAADAISPIVGYLQIPAGSASAMLVILPFFDEEAEGTERAVIRIVPDPSYAVGEHSTAELVIMDRDYDSWASRRFGGAAPPGMMAAPGNVATALGDGGMTGDPDSDGIPNLLEYALVGDPMVSAVSLRPSVGLLATNGVAIPAMTTRRLKGISDVAYGLEGLEEGGRWVPLPSIDAVEQDHGDGTVTVRTWQDIGASPSPHPIVRITVTRLDARTTSMGGTSR